MAHYEIHVPAKSGTVMSSTSKTPYMPEGPENSSQKQRNSGRLALAPRSVNQSSSSIEPIKSVQKRQKTQSDVDPYEDISVLAENVGVLKGKEKADTSKLDVKGSIRPSSQTSMVTTREFFIP